MSAHSYYRVEAKHSPYKQKLPIAFIRTTKTHPFPSQDV